MPTWHLNYKRKSEIILPNGVPRLLVYIGKTAVRIKPTIFLFCDGI
jgi:hypothetical protein